ncbi:PVC-type heme-binding CxxCH protein [Allorhodopirellula solitaria]|uniref:Trehalose utilization n=1 Tax=Allorhodopirellula solitaria TaxID=2527987 RepID=A0A5C5XVL3_9BACT|nr:PVC-type heme-binding CxxCH protein [Allorhodopirellula solitaria]TWT66443.1 Trehalose utilization [Allorhodopirellula solitaria]
MFRLALCFLCFSLAGLAQAADLTALFLGDNGPHQPRARFDELQPVLADRGISLVYTDDLRTLTKDNLEQYDALIVFANIDEISKDRADAILDYVAEGGGFVPLHCASFCFRNQPDLVALMGAQFQRHGTGVFQAEIADPDHELMQGYGGFRSWDETYVHHLHNDANRTVLEYRVDEEGREPWTWIRTDGQGRVFYTASGHDGRTWNNAGFQNLVERGIRWAAGGDPAKAGNYLAERRFDAPEMTAPRTDVADAEFIDVGPEIPNYTPSDRWGVQGKPKTLMQKPLPPGESIKHFVTPVGLAVERYADERDFQAKPIAMTWDARGRLWLCETLDYPNELGKDRDRIRICEDTDGDAVADKFTVFAEGLSIPTSIVIVRGGAVVQNGTETIYLKDTDGDDVADEKTTLITGWSLGDTHGGVSNFRYGLDNWIWAMQGYNNSRPEFAGGQSQSFRQGFWRFKLSQSDPPQVTDLEFVRSSDNNTWGLGISEEGLIFGSTANHNPSMFMPIPNRYYERVRGWAPSTLHAIADTHKFDPITENVRQVDHHGGYTAGAGHALYTARAFPAQWWNRTAFVAGPTGHLVGTFVLSPQGANFTSTSPLNLLASDDEWSAPVMAEVGPDGAVWVLDWYNYIVQHNPTPNGFQTGKGAAYESDLRDKRHGRIYRVVPAEEGKLHDFTDLAAASDEDLVQTLSHPSMRWRLHAQRLLIERDACSKAEIKQKLVELIGDENVDPIGLNVAAIHALRTLHGSNALTGQAVASGLKHPSAGVRRSAIAVMPADATGSQTLLEHKSLFRDANAQVRLQAILTLADMPTSRDAGKLVVELASGETDPILIDALTSAAATHCVPFLESVATSKATATGPLANITERVSEHVARQQPDADRLERIVASLSDAAPSLSVAILDGLTRGLPNDFTIATNESLHKSLVETFQNVGGPVQVKLLRLAARAGIDALDSEADMIIDSIMDVMADQDAAPTDRLSAARDLIGFRANDPGVVAEILETITPQTSPELAGELLSAIKRSNASDAGDVLIEALAAFSPSVKSSAIDVVLSKPDWAKSLLSAAEANEFDFDELSLEQKQSLRAFPDKSMQSQAEALLARGGGLPDADREKVLQSLMHVTKLSGNVDAGRAVFKKVCANCHQHGDMGQKVGPNLTGMAVHPKAELLTHIVDPSRNVEGNYRMYSVLTLDGLIINGMLAGESKTSITIVDSQAKKISVPREDIEELIASRKSVMPEGFEKQISESELSDLLEFLTDTGGYVPIPLDEFSTAISTKGLFSNSDRGPDRMVFENWGPKVFQGVPFLLTDPQNQTVPNLILLHGPNGPLPPKMPRSVSIPLGSPATAIHLLSGVGGWSFPFSTEQTVSMIVRLHYAGGETEDHELKNGIHFADYIRRVDVPGSEFAFALGQQQIRYLSVSPQRDAPIERLEFVKGDDISAPMIMAVTVEQARGGDANTEPE